MQESDALLAPFQEPLRWELLLDAVLSDAREETYSAALAWSLGELTVGQVADVPGIQVFAFRGRDWKRSIDWLYDTEVAVPEGHEGPQGRIDITITFQKRALRRNW
ncbi:MAG: hypothetical protein LAP87_27280 [Acidobacteriia bacterium]|nr:hypothetical protein [Terriglobia bacterium]